MGNCSTCFSDPNAPSHVCPCASSLSSSTRENGLKFSQIPSNFCIHFWVKFWRPRIRLHRIRFAEGTVFGLQGGESISNEVWGPPYSVAPFGGSVLDEILDEKCAILSPNLRLNKHPHRIPYASPTSPALVLILSWVLLVLLGSLPLLIPLVAVVPLTLKMFWGFSPQHVFGGLTPKMIWGFNPQNVLGFWFPKCFGF